MSIGHVVGNVVTFILGVMMICFYYFGVFGDASNCFRKDGIAYCDF